MQDLLESKSQHFPLEIRMHANGDTILHAAVNEENIETVYSILEYVHVEKEEKGWLENHKIRKLIYLTKFHFSNYKKNNIILV